MLVDTHAHLYWESFKEDFDQMIQRALDAGVTIIINVGVDVTHSDIALAQVQQELAKFANLTSYSTIGIHPEEAIKYFPDSNVSIQRDIDDLEKLYLSNTKKVVAVGECGLDFLFANHPWNSSPPLSPDHTQDLQRQLFQAQIDLARKLNLPLLVHCRDDRSGSINSPPTKTSSSPAWDEVIDLTKDHFGIYHCYSGLPQTTNSILQTTNFLISFAGNITYPKNDYLRDAARLIPLERITLETDCPFLAPQSKRGQRNEPANILEIARIVAEVKRISVEEVTRQTTENVRKLFFDRTK